MSKVISFLKQMNPDFRFSLIVIFSLPTLYLVLYLLSKTFTFVSKVLSIIWLLIVSLISSIETVITPHISNISVLFLLQSMMFVCLCLIINNISKKNRDLKSEIQDLKDRIKKIENQK
jgi:hypothetical protein